MFGPGVPDGFAQGRLSVDGPAPRRDRVTFAQVLRFEPSHFQQVRQQDEILRRRHLRQMRRHGGNVVGDLMIGLTALISHEFCPGSKP